VTGARRALLALGSNLGDRLAHLQGAVDALGAEVVATSAVYETPPVGGPEQGPYLNAVVALRTADPARRLLERAHEVEAAAQRVRIERWGPRTLDVDVLWVDGEVVDEPDLVVPHPRMFERAFVLVPLADVAPDLVPDDAPTDPAIVRVGSLVAPRPAGNVDRSREVPRDES
jgi:2-amino-4-hydroxy-6-hydroxymethyldihydropteridine diphosphokinase